MDRGEERIGLNGVAAILDIPPETVRRFAEEGRLRSERGEDDTYVFYLEDVLGLARDLGAESAEEEIFEGEVMGDESSGTSRLPAVPFERYERLWSEIERLNLVEFQRELQEKTISTLEEEKARLESEREHLLREQMELT